MEPRSFEGGGPGSGSVVAERKSAQTLPSWNPFIPSSAARRGSGPPTLLSEIMVAVVRTGASRPISPGLQPASTDSGSGVPPLSVDQFIQRGRVRLNAEIRVWCGRRAGRADASTRPRPFERGNAVVESKHPPSVALQRGRVRLNAEMWGVGEEGTNQTTLQRGRVRLNAEIWFEHDGVPHFV